MLAMSTRAYNAFTEDQKRVLRWVGAWGGCVGWISALWRSFILCRSSAQASRFHPRPLDSSRSPSPHPERRRHVAALHHANIDTLEHIGGGGVRCTLAELF